MIKLIDRLQKEYYIQNCICGRFIKAIGFCVLLFSSFEMSAQEENRIVRALVEAGFENVRVSVVEDEEIITFENAVWKANGVGISHAMQLISMYPPLAAKKRRVIVLNNNVPQISLLSSSTKETFSNATFSNWSLSYDLGRYWSRVRADKRVNSSVRKIDLVFYPQFAFRNQKYHKIYDIQFNIAPTLEISPMRGMRFYGQLVIPIFNEYGPEYDDVRLSIISLEQNFRLENCFVRGTIGTFTQNRWGVDLSVFRPFTKAGWIDHFALEGRLGLTGSSYIYDWNWHYGNLKLLTWNVGGSYYNAQFNVLCKVKVEKFVAEDIGVRADMIRFFRQSYVGFYIMKNDTGNLDGGFYFAFTIPPFRQKRGKYIRVTPARYFDLEYRAAGLFYKGKSYKTRPGESNAIDNFNPYYIKSQL